MLRSRSRDDRRPVMNRTQSVWTVLAAVAVLASSRATVAQTWSSGGLPLSAFEPAQTQPAPAPRRDLSGIWDAGRNGINGTGHVGAPFTPWAQEKLKEI